MGLKQPGARGSIRNLSVAASVIPADATNYWPHDEGEGTTLRDTVGSVPGTINGATWQSGVGTGGFYLDYDGTDDFTDLGAASRTAFKHFTENGLGSFGCWINPDAVDSFNNIFSSTFSTADVGLGSRFQDDGDLIVVLRKGTTGDSMADATAVDAVTAAEGWVPIAFTADGSTLRVFVGETMTEEATGAISGSSSADFDNNVNFARRGDNDPGQEYDGAIDGAWLSDVNISQSDLQQWAERSAKFY